MNLKIVSNLFLGRQELNFLQDSMKSEGYIRVFQQLIRNYGVIKKEENDPLFNYLRIVSGTSPVKITLKAGIAIDKNINAIEIKQDLIDILNVPGDSVTRYVIIKYQEMVIEEGTVNVDVVGGLTGTGSFFTKKLRGLPDFPSKISFPNSTSNTGEYTIQSVTDDITAQLNIAAGLMVAENDLQYKVVGTFTPGIPILVGNKYPFVGDGYDIRLDVSLTVIQDEEFILAKIVSDGISTTITDMRLDSVLQINPPENLLPSQLNPLIGVELAQHHSIFHNNDTNRIKVGWGFRATSGNWTYSASLNQINISAGSGGIWSDTTGFTPGDFDGWECFFKNTGKAIQITASTVSGTDIVLQLAPTGTIPTTSDIIINPKATQIEITSINTLAPNALETFEFDIVDGYGFITALAHIGTVQLKYRLINLDKCGTLTNINDGSYLNENSFDSQGNATSPALSNVVGATITLLKFTDNFYQSKAWLNKPNTFSAINQWGRGSDIFYSGIDQKIILSTTGNTFRIIANSSSPITWMSGYNEGTFLCIHIVAGISSFLRFATTGGPGSLPGYAKIDCENDPNLSYAEYAAGDTLFFVKVETPSLSPSRWRLIGAKSGANAKKTVNEITSPWINVPLNGTNVVQNTTAGGTGADTPLNGSLGTQAPQSGSFLKYKIIGKTVHVSYKIESVILTTGIVANVGSVIIRGALPVPNSEVNNSCFVECRTHPTLMTGAQRALIYPGNADIIFSTQGLDTSNTAWNITYTFASTTSVSVQQTVVNNFNPRFSISGQMTYEIA